MREILFRGLSINGSWFFGNLSIVKKKFKNIDKGCYISNSAGMPFAYNVRPETVGQYTGLKDKNWKKIFEGDIIKIEKYQDYGTDDPPRLNDMGVCVYDSGCFCYESIMDGWNRDLWEVNIRTEIIGNIHQNQDLFDEIR